MMVFTKWGREWEWRGGGGWRGGRGGGGGESGLSVLPSPTSSASIPPLKSGLLSNFVRNFTPSTWYGFNSHPSGAKFIY